MYLVREKFKIWVTDLVFGEYCNNILTIKQFLALAFGPSFIVADSFNLLVGSLDDGLDDLLSIFLIYFETTWIGIVQGGTRRQHLFHIDL